MHWRRFFRRKRSDAELAQEIELHLAQEIADNRTRGMSEEEAGRQAHLKFGSTRRVREEIWQINTFALLDNVWRDLKYATRTLARSPGFTVMAVLVMALGIGANTALFTVVRSVLLKPLPYKDPGRLVAVLRALERYGYSGQPRRRVSGELCNMAAGIKELRADGAPLPMGFL